MTAEDRVAEFIREITWDDLPDDVRRRAKMCLLDTLGAMIGGTLTPVSRITAEYAAEIMRGDDATIILHQRRASVAGAAFANAWAANGLDIDDDAIYTRGHPGAQVIPTALAACEKSGERGVALLEAIVVGYEVAIRAGHCWHHHHQVYQADGSWGAVACAATTARVLQLDPAQIKHAFGIAEYFAPNVPMMRDIAHPTMVKHGIGWGALTGVMATELAQRGFTGIPSILSFDVYHDWVSDIGARFWMSDGVFYKAWASCAWGHPACVAARELIAKNKIALDDIAHIRVRAFDEAVQLTQDYPRTTEEAQFSIAYPLVCLLLDGELGPRQILESRFSDQRVRALTDKIEIVLDPEIDALYDSLQETDLRMHGRVEIILRDGRRFDSGIIERGADNWDEARLENKFRWLTGHVLDARVMDRLIEMIWRMDRVARVDEPTRLLQ